MEVMSDIEHKAQMNLITKQKIKIRELCIKLAVNYRGSFRSEQGCIQHSNLNNKRIDVCDGCPALSYCPFINKKFTK